MTESNKSQAMLKFWWDGEEKYDRLCQVSNRRYCCLFLGGPTDPLPKMMINVICSSGPCNKFLTKNSISSGALWQNLQKNEPLFPFLKLCSYLAWISARGSGHQTFEAAQNYASLEIKSKILPKLSAKNMFQMPFKHYSCNDNILSIPQEIL